MSEDEPDPRDLHIVGHCEMAYTSDDRHGIVMRLKLGSRNQPPQSYYLDEELMRSLLERLKEALGEAPAPKSASLRN